MIRVSSAAILAMLFVAGITATVSAVPVKFIYTADNVVGAWYQNGGAPISLPLGPNADEWWEVDEATLELDICEEYQIIWHTINIGTHGVDNPGSFLGEIQSQYLPADILLSSAKWEVYVQMDSHSVPSDFDTISWSAATQYNKNNDPNGIWDNVGIGSKPSDSPVAGISGDAWWIWGPNNFDDLDAPDSDDSVFIRVKVHPVPEPSIILLLTTSLSGMVAYGLRRKKKA